MRQHGRASIDAKRPRALAICQRCGAMYNHDQLRWQFEYGGMRLINLRILVCQSCYDTPQIQLRTILLPADPIPIEFPVPEFYSNADNPISAIGFNPHDNFATIPSTLGMNIGNLTFGAGLNSAFDGNIKKQYWRGASISVSLSSYQNTIGKNWNAGLTTPPLPALLLQPALQYNITSFTVNAPSDQPIFGGGITGLEMQGSNDGATWTVLYSTTTAGTVGESVTSVSSNITQGNYQYHRIAIQGDGVNAVYVAQVQFNTNNTGQNEQ